MYRNKFFILVQFITDYYFVISILILTSIMSVFGDFALYQQFGFEGPSLCNKHSSSIVVDHQAEVVDKSYGSALN